MTYYADLSLCDYFPSDAEGRLVAVGWLDAEFPNPKGDVDSQFMAKLVELLTDPWQPAATMGRHECSFCRFSGGPAAFQFENTTVNMGVSNVFVPASGVIYVAPSLILQYIDSHGYVPPERFQQAVMKCPPMKSMPYSKAVLANGGRGIV
jgi:hypothetical protein